MAAWLGSGSEGTSLGYSQGTARMSLGHPWGITRALLDHLGDIQASLGHLWGLPRALLGHTRQVRVTLSSLQGLSSEQQVRAGCPGLCCARRGHPCPRGGPGAGAQLPKHSLDKPSVALAGCEASPRGLPPALHDVPLVVALSEDVEPGTRVAEVTVSCSNTSGSPNVTLHGIEPNHPFNPIAISADPTAADTFRAEVRLGDGDQGRSPWAPC